MNTLRNNSIVYLLGDIPDAAGTAALSARLRALGVNVRDAHELHTAASARGVLALGRTDDPDAGFLQVLAGEYGIPALYDHQLLRECERLEAAARVQARRDRQKAFIRLMIRMPHRRGDAYRCAF